MSGLLGSSFGQSGGGGGFNTNNNSGFGNSSNRNGFVDNSRGGPQAGTSSGNIGFGHSGGSQSGGFGSNNNPGFGNGGTRGGRTFQNHSRGGPEANAFSNTGFANNGGVGSNNSNWSRGGRQNNSRDGPQANASFNNNGQSGGFASNNKPAFGNGSSRDGPKGGFDSFVFPENSASSNSNWSRGGLRNNSRDTPQANASFNNTGQSGGFASNNNPGFGNSGSSDGPKVGFENSGFGSNNNNNNGNPAGDSKGFGNNSHGGPQAGASFGNTGFGQSGGFASNNNSGFGSRGGQQANAFNNTGFVNAAGSNNSNWSHDGIQNNSRDGPQTTASFNNAGFGDNNGFGSNNNDNGKPAEEARGFGNNPHGGPQAGASFGNNGFGSNINNDGNRGGRGLVNISRGGRGGFRGRGENNANMEPLAFNRAMGARGNRREFDGAAPPQRRSFFGDNNMPQKDFDPDETLTEPKIFNYVPTARLVDDLYIEDTAAAKDYAEVVDKDEDVQFENFDGRLEFMITTWDEAMFHPQLLKNIKERSKYIRPRKIQSATIPFIMDGYDVKGQAETGCGKTAAFILPIIQRCMEAKDDKVFVSDMACPYAIVLGPTRELVLQVFEQAEKFALDTGITVAKAYGQYEVAANLTEICKGCDILIATPGRLKHFINNGDVLAKNLKFLVLDEADKIMEFSFFLDIRQIISTPGFPTDDDDRQTLMFSATFTPQLQSATKYMLRPDAVFVTNHQNLPNKRIKQEFIVVQPDKKLDELGELLMKEKEKAGGNLSRTIVFTNDKRQCKMAAFYLCNLEIEAVSLSSVNDQNKREQALLDFRKGLISVLVASDVGARGLDVKELDHVINMDMPDNINTYIYRIGRTGRIKDGRATSFIDKTEYILKPIVAMMKQKEEEIPDVLKDIVVEEDFYELGKNALPADANFDENDPAYWD